MPRGKSGGDNRKGRFKKKPKLQTISDDESESEARADAGGDDGSADDLIYDFVPDADFDVFYCKNIILVVHEN